MEEKADGRGVGGGVTQLSGRHPGCMWGVLHVLKYQRWRYIKKRLPYYRPPSASPQHPPPTTGIHGEGGSKTQRPPPAPKKDDHCNSAVEEEKPAKSITSTVRSRLKSLISDELYRKKDSQHHRRSHTCPVPQQPPQPQKPLQHTVDHPPPHEPAEAQNSSISHQHDQEKQSREGEFSTSKEIVEALDMAIMNKEFMATILQDPHSHFVPQFTTHKRYSKSVSFPSTGFDCSLKEPPHKQQGRGQANEAEKSDPKELEIPLLKSTSYTRSRSLSSTIAAVHRPDGIAPLKQSVTTLNGNKTAMRRLKDLKQKIRHVITMEAVLHKIPRGGSGGSSGSKEMIPSPINRKDGGNDINVAMMSPRRSYAGDCCKFVLASKTDNQKLKRTSSLCESLDKYCHLYESTFNRETKQKSMMSEDPKVKDDSVVGVIDDTPVLCDDKIPVVEIAKTIESKEQDAEEADQTNEVSSSLTRDDAGQVAEQKTPSTVEESNEKLVHRGMLILEDASTTPETAINSVPTVSSFKDSRQILENLIATKLNFLKDQRAESIIDDIIEAEEELNEKNELQSKHNQTDYEVIEFYVDSKDKENFDYVKEILEISGFTQKELLGAWHSNDQPLDPAVFDEAGGDNFNHHLAMFDLINEVLMEIYAKSHTYCPKALSWLSHIKPMPVGSHVLKEVWGKVRWSLTLVPDENEHVLNFVVGRDFEKSDGWMNLQFDCECVGLELEDWIFDDLLDELVFEDDPRGSIFL